MFAEMQIVILILLPGLTLSGARRSRFDSGSLAIVESHASGSTPLCKDEDKLGCEVQVFVNLQQSVHGMKAFVQRMSPQETGLTLAKIVADRTGMPLGSFRLVLGTHQLLPEESLQSQGIRNDVNINVLLLAKGGLVNAIKSDWSGLDFLVEIRTASDGGIGICSGTISGNKVLTAAHCVVFQGEVIQTQSGLPSDARSEPIHIRAHSAEPGHEFLFFAEHISVHPDYNDSATTDEGDVAIISLKPAYVHLSLIAQQGNMMYEEFKYFPSTELGFARDESSWTSGQMHTLAGFGLSSNDPGAIPARLGGVSDGLYVGSFFGFQCEADVTNTSVACASSNALNRNGTEVKSKLASCAGDSGGPWFMPDPWNMYRLTPRLLLAGVHSSGGDCHTAHSVDAISHIIKVRHASVYAFLKQEAFVAPADLTYDGTVKALGMGREKAQRDLCRSFVPDIQSRPAEEVLCRKNDVAIKPGRWCLGSCKKQDCHQASPAKDAMVVMCSYVHVQKDCGVIGYVNGRKRPLCISLPKE